MFKFKKVASVLASAVMLGSTVALAAATTYPAPFSSSDTALVYGAAGQITDFVAVTDIQNNLKGTGSSGGGSTGGTVSGEAAAVFEGSTKLYANDTLNNVKTVLTKTNLPTVLQDGSYSGNVDATFTQTLVLGGSPTLVSFAKAPTSSDDPAYVLALGTTPQTQPIYNATVNFNKAINFTHADSKGADLTMFGQKFTVASSTDSTNLVLLKTAEKVSLSTDSPTASVTIGGKEYTVELVSASDSAATVKVTDSNGNSETKEVNENASKKIQGVTIAVTNADETNLKLSASVIAGAEKVTLTDASSVTYGEDNKILDGTYVSFGGTTTYTGNISQLRVSVSAPNSDKDAIKGGSTMVDPVFGSFKVDFSAGMSNPMNSSNRDEIKFTPSSDDKMQINFKDYNGKEATQVFAKNLTAGGLVLQGDNDGRNISVFERSQLYKNEFLVVGNENTGHLIKVSSIVNQTSGYADDRVKFTDIFSGDIYEASLTSEGSGTVVIGGKSYDVAYSGANSVSEDVRTVRLNYPDSAGAGVAVLYPTIQTYLGGKIQLYKPVILNLSNWDGADTDMTGLRIPNGNGYQDITVAINELGNFTIGTTVLGNGTTSSVQTVGRLSYNFTYDVRNQTTVYLVSPAGGNIVTPAVVLIEEKDDNSNYESVVVTLETGATSDDGLGINTVARSWSPNGADSGWSDTLASNSKITKKADLFGTIITIDAGDSDQQIASLSYPDEQINAQLYFAKNDASISSSSSSSTPGTGGYMAYTDDEAASYSGKNIIVVGGSCINMEAARLLGFTGKTCGNDFTAATQVGAGQYLIQSFDRTGGKVATLVAGYNAADTTNAAKCLIAGAGCVSGGIDTSANMKYTGTSATQATLSTTGGTA